MRSAGAPALESHGRSDDPSKAREITILRSKPPEQRKTTFVSNFVAGSPRQLAVGGQSGRSVWPGSDRLSSGVAWCASRKASSGALGLRWHRFCRSI